METSQPRTNLYDHPLRILRYLFIIAFAFSKQRLSVLQAKGYCP